MTTIKDVARIAGVSVATVSRVANNATGVSNKTKVKVSAVMENLGYTPNANARALVTQKSTVIGVVIPDLTDPFFALLASGVERVARQENVQLLLSTGLVDEKSERDAINVLLERQCSAMVVHSKKLADEEMVNFCKKIPGLILINRYIEEIYHRCIWLDNFEGGKLVARHLLALKHQSFACISSQYKIDDPSLRLKGFQKELNFAGYEVDRELIAYGKPDLKGGEMAAQKLLASNKKFTALFVYNDAMAIGAMSTLEDNGYRVPIDISVIGFDDVLLSQYSKPRLTTLNYPIEEMAVQAANIAMKLAKSEIVKDITSDFKYIPALVKRDSTSRYVV